MKMIITMDEAYKGLTEAGVTALFREDGEIFYGKCSGYKCKCIGSLSKPQVHSIIATAANQKEAIDKLTEFIKEEEVIYATNQRNAFFR